MRGFLTTSALVMAMAAPAVADDAAFLLGVSRYDNYDRVARATSILGSVDGLKDQGFEIFQLGNGDWTDVRRNLRGFAAEAEDASRLVVILAGQFVTDGNQTWLVTKEASKPATSVLAGQDAIPIEALMQVISQTAGDAVMVLGHDGQTDEVTRGLREGLGPLDIPQGVTVIKGDVRSVARFVTNTLPQSGANLDQAIASDDALSAEGYLPRNYTFLELVSEGSEDDGRDPVVVSTTDLTELEDARWGEAQNLDTEDAYRTYLRLHPQGRYAVQARIAIDKIVSEPFRDARLAEEALTLSRDQRRDIQRDLTILDYNTRGIDGIFGPGSRRAIANWQQQNGFEQTTYMNAAHIRRLDNQASRRSAELEAEAERKRQEQLRADRAYWNITGAQGDEIGLRSYIERYPDGAFSEEAKERLAAIEEDKRDRADREDRAQWNQARSSHTVAAYQTYLRRFPGGAFRNEAQARIAELQRDDSGEERRRQWIAQERALGLNVITAQLVERKLASLRLEPGRVDGRFDGNTRRALRRYQQARGLPVTGYMNEATAVRLLADSVGGID